MDTTFTLVHGFITFHLLLPPSAHSLMQNAQNCQLYALYFSLPVTLTIFVLHHNPAISIFFRGLSLHISASNLLADMAVVCSE